MNLSRGFISLVLVIVGLAILGGVGWWATQQTATTLLDSTEEPNSSRENEWKTYRNAKFGFELQYPPELTTREENGSDPRIGDNWMTVSFSDPVSDFNLRFFAGQRSTGAPGEGMDLLKTKTIVVAGKEVQEALLVEGNQVVLSIFTQHAENRYDSFSAHFTRSQIEEFVPKIEAIVTTLKYFD